MHWSSFAGAIRDAFSVSLGLAVWLACTGGASARAQSVANPGFETGSLSSWQTVVFGSQGSVAVGGTAHAGRYGLVQGPNNGDEVAYQDISGLTPGQTYVVSVWAASSTPTASTVSLAIHDTTGNHWASTDIVPVNTWQQFSQTYTVNGTGAMRIHLYENPGTETTYWDEVTLEPVLPLNGGFETGSLRSWQTVVFGSQGSVTVAQAAHSGNYGLVQGPNTGNEVAYQDLFGLVPGQTYLVSAWVAASSTNTGTVTLAIHDTQGGNWQSKGFTPSTFWQQISQAYTVNGSGAMRIHLYENQGPETTYWDDVTITPVPPVNAGFETGSLGPWQTAVFGNQGSVSVGTVPRSGNYGLTQGPNTGSEVAYQDLTGLIPGQTYLVSAWVRSSTATSSTVSLAVHGFNDGTWVSTDLVPSTTWGQISQSFTVGSNGILRMHLYENAGSETTYWDDVSVVPLPPVNAGFESGMLSPWQSSNGTVGPVAHSGHYGLTQSANGSAQVTFQDVYGLVPGQTYFVSAWVLSSAPTSSTVSFAIHDTLGNGWVGKTITPTTSWQQVSQAFTADSTGAMRIHLYTNPGAEVTYWDDLTVTSTNGQSAAALFAADMALWGGFNNGGLWSNSSFLSISPSEPSKEYIRFNGQPIAIENEPEQ